MVEHNYNHPSIVAWNPGALPLAQRITKAMDYTRPVCLD
jgi:D-hexose-6-phosphate mutarotase